MNSITVTVNLSDEDRERLDRIYEALTSLKPQEKAPIVREPIRHTSTEPPTEPVQEQPALEPAAEPQPEQPEPADDSEPIPEPKPQPEPAPQHTRAELQHLVVTLTSAGKKAEVRAIVLAVASKVSDIPEDKIDEVFEQLKALEGVNE